MRAPKALKSARKASGDDMVGCGFWFVWYEGFAVRDLRLESKSSGEYFGSKVGEGGGSRVAYVLGAELLTSSFIPMYGSFQVMLPYREFVLLTLEASVCHKIE